MANIAGVVLAGGRSSRMGSNKAFLEYNGIYLIEHMKNLLQATGLNDIYISGDVEGYKTIPDSQKFNGPHSAIIDVMAQLNDYDGALFVPVDMPLLTADILQRLINDDCSAYFKKHPLPIYIAIALEVGREVKSVKDIIKTIDAKSMDLPIEFQESMQNINTPEDLATLS